MRNVKPSDLSKYLVLVGCWTCGLLEPFHALTRLRQTYENFNTLDIILLVASIILPIIFFLIYHRYFFKMMLAGFIGIAIVSYLAFLFQPVMVFSYQGTPPVTVLGVELHAISIIFGLFAGLGTLIFACFCEHLKEEREKGGDKLLGVKMLGTLLIACATIWFFIQFLHDSHSIYVITGTISSVSVVAMGITPKGTVKVVKKGVKNRKKAALNNSNMFFSWLLFTVNVMGSAFFLFRFLSDQREYVNISCLMINLIAGSGILIALLLPFKDSKVMHFIYQGIISTSIATMYYLGTIGEFYVGQYFLAGIAISFSAFQFLSRILKSKAKFAILFSISWVASAYLAFIPEKIESIVEYQDWIYYAVFGLIALSLLNAIFEYRIDRLKQLIGPGAS
ncbi:MAG: hypothetical protein ACFFCS_02155 [Candidatus Hodarchaeota archaeon]